MQQMQAGNGVFKTADIVLASYLMAKGSELVGVDDSDHQHVKFFIRPLPSPDDLAVFVARDALAPVHSFYSALRKCKRALYNGGAT